MTTDNLSAKLNELKTLMQSVQQYVAAYEGQLGNKEIEMQNMDRKLSAIRDEHKAEQSKSGSVLSKASEEAAQMRQEAKQLLDSSRDREAALRQLQAQADAAIAEAKARSAKLQSDEQAFHNTVVVFERRKAALESALNQ